MMKWVLIAGTVLLSSCGDILCAKGMSAGKELEAHNAKEIVLDVEYIVTRKLVIVGWICYAVSFFSLLGLFSVAEMTVAVPATAFSFVIDTIGAYYILKEQVHWRRWVGVLCVTAGVILAVKPGPTSTAVKPPASTGTASAGTASTGFASTGFASAGTASTWTTRSGGVAVESCKDQPGYHHASPNELHQQGAGCEVLAKP